MLTEHGSLGDREESCIAWSSGRSANITHPLRHPPVASAAGKGVRPPSSDSNGRLDLPPTICWEGLEDEPSPSNPLQDPFRGGPSDTGEFQGSISLRVLELT